MNNFYNIQYFHRSYLQIATSCNRSFSFYSCSM